MNHQANYIHDLLNWFDHHFAYHSLCIIIKCVLVMLYELNVCTYFHFCSFFSVSHFLLLFSLFSSRSRRVFFSLFSSLTFHLLLLLQIESSKRYTARFSYWDFDCWFDAWKEREKKIWFNYKSFKIINE